MSSVTPRYQAGSLAVGLARSISGAMKRRRRNQKAKASSARKKLRFTKPRRSTTTRRGRSITRTKKYKGDVQAAHRELTKTTLKGGRKLRRTLRNIWKVESRKTHKSIFGYDNISPFGGTSGAENLSVEQSAAGAPVICGNVRIWSLTAVANTDQTNTIQIPTCHWFMQLSNQTDTADVSFTAHKTTAPILTSGPPNNTGNYPNDRSTLSYVAARFLLYNAINSPGKYMIEIVSFRDERLLPSAVNTTVADKAFATAFWQNLSKPYIYSPIVSQTPSLTKYMNVHKRLFILMDSKDSNETVATNYKEVNVFHRFNKSCRYDWEQNDKMDMFGPDIQTNIGDNQTDVKPSQRVYLLMRSLVTRPQVYPIVFDANKMASFDVSFRTCHITDR